MSVLWDDEPMKKRGSFHEKVPIYQEQIVFTLRRGENVTPAMEVCRRMGIAEQTSDILFRNSSKLSIPL